MSFSALKSHFKDTHSDEDDSIVGDALLRLNDQYAYLLTPGGVAAAEPTETVYTLIKSTAAAEYHKNLYVEVDGNKKSIWQIWTKWANRRSYTEVEFGPSKEPAQWPTGSALNMWRGFAGKPVEGDCKLILDHILEVLCDGDQIKYDYVIRWMAQRIQQPWVLPEIAIVCIGQEGAGKSLVAELLGDIIGKTHAHTITGGDGATDRFNAAMENKVFILAEEAAFGGGTRAGGIWKNLITGKTMRIERKYIDAGTVDNYFGFWIISNETESSTGVTLGSRRYFHLDVSSKRRGGVAYFNRLFECIENGGREAFHYHLKHEVKLDGFNSRQPPQSYSYYRLKDQILSAPSTIQWLFEVLTDEGNTECLNLADKWREGPVEALKEDVYKDYVEFCNTGRKGKYERKSKNVFCRELYQVMEGLIKPIRMPEQLSRMPGIWFASLKDCRLGFYENIMQGRGVPMWDDDITPVTKRRKLV